MSEVLALIKLFEVWLNLFSKGDIFLRIFKRALSSKTQGVLAMIVESANDSLTFRTMAESLKRFRYTAIQVFKP